MVMSKHFESTFKTINLRLRRWHSFEQLKPIQTLNFYFCRMSKRKVRNFKNLYVQHRHSVCRGKPIPICYKIEIFVLSVLTEILAPLSNLTWEFLHYFYYKLMTKLTTRRIFKNKTSHGKPDINLTKKYRGLLRVCD
jgi:hypothetical protein